MKSHRPGENVCFNSAYRCTSAGDADDEGTYRWAEQERENAITDWHGNLFFHLSGKLLGLVFLDLDVPQLIILSGSKRRVSPGFLFVCVCVVMSFLWLLVLVFSTISIIAYVVRCGGSNWFLIVVKVMEFANNVLKLNCMIII